jgi:hypothetical protein
MNRLLLGALAATLSACAGGDEIATDGGNADLTSSFVGIWTGDSEATDVQSGNPRFGPADDLIIRRTSPEKLALAGFCFGGGAASATVTSPTTFTIDPFACPPFYIGAPPGDPNSCKVVLSISRGSGSLRRHTLTLTTTGSFAGCEARYTLPFWGRYTGAQ